MPINRDALSRHVALWAVLGLCAGCTATVAVPRQVRDPVPVLLLEHGRSTSLVVPADAPSGPVVRYAYGEHRYYALYRRGVPGAMRALLVPSRAAIGRRVMPGPMDAAHVKRSLRFDTQAAHLIQVERTCVARLRGELDALFDAQPEAMVENEALDMTFVPHPSPYFLPSNSNHEVAGWLRALGCEVRVWPVVSHWQVLER